MANMRKIEVNEATVGTWAAIDLLMAEEMYEETFIPTCVVMHWSSKHPSVTVAACEDGDVIIPDEARKLGHVPGRRLASPGGLGIFTPGLPLVAYYYQKPYSKPDVTLHKEADANGEANAEALRKLGFKATYRSIGDTEVIVDDVNLKVIASAATNFFRNDYWYTCTSIIWDPLPPTSMEVFSKSVEVPPEKFQDKKTKSLTARMKPLHEIVQEENFNITKEDVIRASIEENAKLLGAEIYKDSWKQNEIEFINNLKPFFHSNTWLTKFSSKRMLSNASPDYFYGRAAYKSRKLITSKAIVDKKGIIKDILVSGDWLVRPFPTVTSDGIVRDFYNKLNGLRIDDEKAIYDAVNSIFQRDDFEAPLIEPEHVVAPILKSSENLKPVKDIF